MCYRNKLFNLCLNTIKYKDCCNEKFVEVLKQDHQKRLGDSSDDIKRFVDPNNKFEEAMKK